MSLGTENIRQAREVQWEPCEREPGLQVATNQRHLTEETELEK